MIYKIRPGIVLLKICDQDILVATRQIWEKCPVIRPVPRLWAACWSLMEKGRTSEDVIGIFSRLFKSDKINTNLEKAFSVLYDEGLLLAIDDIVMDDEEL